MTRNRALLAASVSHAARVLLATLMAPLFVAPPARAEADGISIAVVSVGKDSPSEGQAVVVGRIAQTGFERNPRYALLDEERVLENGEISAAEQRRAKADEALARAKAAYDALELPVALESSAEAIVGYEQAIAALRDIAPLVTALKVQGASYVLSSDVKNARRSFERALAVDPGLAVSGAGFPAEVTRVVEESRVKMERAPTGSITVYAAPPAAEVWVDGGFRGSAPITIDNLAEGRHYVRVARDGYVAWGQPVEVKRRAEETVQATLRPAARFAELDDLASRLKTMSEQAPGKLAGLLKVDQLLWIVVEAVGDDATVTATLTDGISGKPLAHATKTFVSTSPRYRSDLELWFAQEFRKAQGAQAEGGGGGGGGEVAHGGGGKSQFLPDAPKEAPTSPKTILGWVIFGGAILPLGVGIGFGVGSLVPWDAYKNQGKLFNQPSIQHQLDDDLQEVRNSFIITSIIADAGYVITAIMVATGISLIVWGNTEKEEIEDVLAATEKPPLPYGPIVAGGGVDAPR